MVENLENEVWKDIPNYEGRYKVSNMGRVCNPRLNNRILVPFDRQPNTPREGYLTVHLGSRHLGKRFINFNLHYLVMLSFVGKRPENMVIHHIDGDKTNNKLSNLIYCTQSHNVLEDFKDGRRNLMGEKNTQSVLKEEDVITIVSLKNKIGASIIARKYGVTASAIYSIYYGMTWSYLTLIKPKYIRK